MNFDTFIKRLYEIGVIKLGTFTLKSGKISPIYIDLRGIISYPDLLQAMASFLTEKVKHLATDFVCGVPYTALPIATCISIKENKPMVMVRKESKDYGTKKMVEGVFQPNQSVLIIEDVVTTGSSIVTTIQHLRDAGLKTPYVVAFLDREQGGQESLQKEHCEFHSVITLSGLLKKLATMGIAIPEVSL